MKPMKLLNIILLIYAVMFPQYVLAGTFCAITAFSKNCWYNTYNDCIRAAGSQGTCVINQEEAKPISNSDIAPFCVVTSYSTRCTYWDAQGCRQAAANFGGACAANPNR